MPQTIHSIFVQSVVDEFRRLYPEHTLSNGSDGVSLWFECKSPPGARVRRPLSFGVCDESVTVAFDGLTCPMIIAPPTIEADTARQRAFALFADLISERKVSISFWQGAECFGVEFIPCDQIQSRRTACTDHAVRVRSWTGKYDYDNAA